VSQARMRVAGASVLFGVDEIILDDAWMAGPENLLAWIADIGHEGTELGPPAVSATRASSAPGRATASTSLAWSPPKVPGSSSSSATILTRSIAALSPAGSLSTPRHGSRRPASRRSCPISTGPLTSADRRALRSRSILMPAPAPRRRTRPPGSWVVSTRRCSASVWTPAISGSAGWIPPGPSTTTPSSAGHGRLGSRLGHRGPPIVRLRGLARHRRGSAESTQTWSPHLPRPEHLDGPDDGPIQARGGALVALPRPIAS